MIKQSKLVYIIGSIVIGIVSIIGIIIGMIFGGVLDGSVKSLVFTSGSIEVTYTGENVVCAEWKLESGELKKGHTAIATVTGVQKGVGTSVNAFDVVVLDQNGADVSGDYKIVLNPGSIVVTKRKLELVALDAEKVYDGTPLTSNEYEILSGTLASNHVLEVNFNGEITKVGETENLISALVKNKNGEDVTSNYDLTCSSGLLTVTQRAITITTDDLTQTYNGKVLKASDENCKVTDGEIVDGQYLSVTFLEELKSVGEVENTADIVITDDDGNDHTSNYDIKTLFGNLIITPSRLAIKSIGFERAYNGDELTNHVHEIVECVDPIENGHQLIIDWTGKITNVGQTENTFNVTIKDENGEDVTSNYQIEKDEKALLKVNACNIIINTPNLVEEYNGEPKFNYDGYFFSSGYELPTSTTGTFSLRPISYAEQTDVKRNDKGEIIGTENVVDYAVIFTNSDNEESIVTDNFKIEYKNGTITVNPIRIKIKTKDGLKLYDGKKLTRNEFDYLLGSGTVVSGQDLVINYLGGQVEPGESENKVTVKVKKGNVDLSHNYDLTDVTFGILKVEKIALEVTSNSLSETYNGSEWKKEESTLNVYYNDTTANAWQNVEGEIVNGEYLLENGHVVKITYGASITNVGEVENTVNVKIIMVDDYGYERDVTANYDLTVTNGALKVEAMPITVTVLSNDKNKFVFNGEYQKYAKYQLDMLAQAHIEKYGLTIETYEHTEVRDAGVHDNNLKIDIKLGDNIVTDNYDISYVSGEIHIEKLKIKVTPKITLETKTYNAKSWVTNENITNYYEDNLPNNFTLKYYVNGDYVDVVNNEPINYTCELYYKDKIVANVENYEIDSTEKARITISPIKLTVTTKNVNTVTYNGKAQIKNELFNNGDYYFIQGGILPEHKLECKVNELDYIAITEANGKKVEISSCLVKVKETEEAVNEGNYVITLENLGTIIILPYEGVTLKTDSLGEKTYNGTVLVKENNVRVEGTLANSNHKLELKQIDFTEYNYVDATSEQVLVMAKIKIVDGSGVDVTSNYKINEEFGKIKINPVSLKVVTPDLTGVIYDGTTHHKYQGAQVIEENSNNIIVNLRNDVNGTGTGTLYGDGITFTVIGSISDVKDGGVENNYTLKINGESIETNKNYVVSNSSLIGTLNLTAREVSIKATSATKTYNGENFVHKGYETGSVVGLVTGHKFENVTELQQSKVGTYTYTITSDKGTKIVDAKGNDVTKNYTINCTSGTFEIKKAVIHVTVDTSSLDPFTYNATSHISNANISNYVTCNDLDLSKFNIRYTVDRSKYVNAGSVTVEVTVKVYENVTGEDVTSNFDVQKDESNANITINKADLTVTTKDFGEVYYKGSAYVTNENISDYVESIEGLIEPLSSVRFTVGSEDFKNAGLHFIKPEIYVNGANVTDNYNVTYNLGTIKIKPIQITVETDSLNLDYDGESHSCYENASVSINDVTYEIDEYSGEYSHRFDYGETLTFSITSKITNAGEIDNEVTVNYNGAEEDNYAIITRYGTLKVNPIKISVITPSVEKIYDGEELTYYSGAYLYYSGNEYPFNEDGTVDIEIINGQTISFEIIGKITNAGEVENTVLATYNGCNEDNYEIDKTNVGTLKVNKKEVTLISQSKTFTYNGEQRDWLKLSNLLDVESILYETDGSYLEKSEEEYQAFIEDGGIFASDSRVVAGEHDNTFYPQLVKVLDAEGKVSNNFEIIGKFGIITILPKEIYVVTANGNWVYENESDIVAHYGTEVGDNGVSVTGGALDEHTIIVDCFNKIDKYGEEPNSFTWDVVDTYGISVKENYRLDENASNTGKLVISKASKNPIDNDDKNPTKQKAYYVTSPVGGRTYLKYESFGDVFVNEEGTYWGYLPENNTVYLNGGHTVAFETLSAKASAQTITITKASDGFRDAYPYFSNVSEYLNNSATFSAFPYVYKSAPTEGSFGNYIEYANFVKANYLSLGNLDAETIEVLNGVIEGKGFKTFTSIPTVGDWAEILTVASYVQGKIGYSLEPKNIDNNVVKSFFKNSNVKGYCQHYATAGTALFRALGVPARYTEGIAGDVTAHESTWLYTPGHAWVEVFIYGVGWVPVEVTGGDNNGINPDGDSNPNPPDDGEDKEYKVTPFDYYVQGNPTSKTTIDDYLQGISGNSYIVKSGAFTDFLKENGLIFTAEFTFGNGKTSVTGLGEYEIRIKSYVIEVEETGEDVTNKYVLTCETATLQVFMQEITITTETMIFDYDGLAHSSDEFPAENLFSYTTEGELEVGSVECVFNTVVKKANEEVANMPVTVTIYDEYGEDITKYFKINYDLGYFIVEYKQVIIKSGSTDKDKIATIEEVNKSIINLGIDGYLNSIERSKREIIIPDKNGDIIVKDEDDGMIDGEIDITDFVLTDVHKDAGYRMICYDFVYLNEISTTIDNTYKIKVVKIVDGNVVETITNEQLAIHQEFSNYKIIANEGSLSGYQKI